jgi:hypothetical protein
MRRVLVALLGLGLVLGVSSAASAAEVSKPGAILDASPRADERVVGDERDSMASGRGVGYLKAHGDGVAGLEGKGRIDVAGFEKLYVSDVAGDAHVRIEGRIRRTALRDVWVAYVGSGRAHIRGSHVKVVARGHGVSVRARGKGRFVLRGKGRFETNGIKGTWPARGAFSS